VLNGMQIAPMRAMASHATTQSLPYVNMKPMRVPFPTPAASSCLPTRRDATSASA
jgi:hypothetical protein